MRYTIQSATETVEARKGIYKNIKGSDSALNEHLSKCV